MIYTTTWLVLTLPLTFPFNPFHPLPSTPLLAVCISLPRSMLCRLVTRRKTPDCTASGKGNRGGTPAGTLVVHQRVCEEDTSVGTETCLSQGDDSLDSHYTPPLSSPIHPPLHTFYILPLLHILFQVIPLSKKAYAFPLPLSSHSPLPLTHHYPPFTYPVLHISFYTGHSIVEKGLCGASACSDVPM